MWVVALSVFIIQCTIGGNYKVWFFFNTPNSPKPLQAKIWKKVTSDKRYKLVNKDGTPYYQPTTPSPAVAPPNVANNCNEPYYMTINSGYNHNNRHNKNNPK